MAGGAGGVGAVLFELGAEGGGFFRVFLEFGDGVRGRGDGGAEDGVEEPVAAEDGAGAVGAGGFGEDAAHAEETAAGMAFDADLAELGANDVGDLVVAGEGFVEVGVVGEEDVADGTILADEAFEE